MSVFGAAGMVLGYAQITSTFNTTNSTATQVTGLTSTVTVPGGGKVIVTAYTSLLGAGGTGQAYMEIWDGTVGSGTQISQAEVSSAYQQQGIAVAVVAPAAGSKTYNVSLRGSVGTMVLQAASTAPAFLLVQWFPSQV